jgi:hypothetical protein
MATVVTGPNGARYLKLSRNFAAFDAVTLNLYLATSAAATTKKNLGIMRARGAQRFLVPASANLGRFKYVIAWCVEFNTPITDAVLRRA